MRMGQHTELVITTAIRLLLLMCSVRTCSFLVYYLSDVNSSESRTTSFEVAPTDEYLCSAFVRQGTIPSSPIRPNLGFSIHTLELFRVAHIRCPQLSQQAFVKTLADLHSVQHQKYLTRQFSIAFDLYLSILAAVDSRVKNSLGRGTGDWRLQHACPACMYKLKDEQELFFNILWAMDGNDSLKRIIRRSPTVDGDPSIPGPSCEQTDTWNISEDMYIPREDVNKWAREVIEQAATSEGVSPRPHSI